MKSRKPLRSVFLGVFPFEINGPFFPQSAICGYCPDKTDSLQAILLLNCLNTSHSKDAVEIELRSVFHNYFVTLDVTSASY